MADPVFEDFCVGDVIVGEPVTVSRDAIVAYARQFDFQDFHTDEERAKATFAGRLIGSGWHTAALGMRLLHDGPFRGGSSLGSPGVDELRWVRPMLPGDSLRLTFTVTGARASASKPGLGIVGCDLRLDDGAGEPVMTQRFSFLLPLRGAEPLPPRPAETGEPPPVVEPEDARVIPFLGEAEIGWSRDLGPFAFDAASILAFARAYDPQVFHVEPEAAKRTHFGGLSASGWHTAAAFMNRLLVTRARDTAHTAAHGPVPAAGTSPGFNNLRWLRPVHAGDTVRYRTRLTDKRASKSRPGWGLGFFHNTGTNQRGEAIFSFDSIVFHQWAKP